MATPRKPRETPAPRERPVPRPFYYPAGWGLLFWFSIFLLIWVLIGLWGGIAWWPWWR